MKKVHILPFLALLFFACQKEEDINSQRDKFRCKINGVEWIPSPSGSNGGGAILGGGGVDIYYENTFIHVIQFNATKKVNNISQFISLGIGIPGDVVGEHPIINDALFTDFRISCGGYKRDTSKVNVINITAIDSTQKIITGTFNFTARMKDCGEEVIKVTDGYFNTRYR